MEGKHGKKALYTHNFIENSKRDPIPVHRFARFIKWTTKVDAFARKKKCRVRDQYYNHQLQIPRY